MKIVYCGTHDGFHLSTDAINYYNKLKGYERASQVNRGRDIPRDDPDLVKTIEYFGPHKSHDCYQNHTDDSVYSDDEDPLSIKEIPDQFSDCYQIWQRSGKEMIYVDPGRLIVSKLLDMDDKVEKMTEQECKSLLEELISIAKHKF